MEDVERVGAMTEKEQLEWCVKNRATVWFLTEGVKVKPQDSTSAIKCKSLLHAIESIEMSHQQRMQMREALAYLDKGRE